MQQTRALAIQRPISQVLWPRSSLAGCILGTFVRDTRGCELTPAERMNFFSASPYCSVSWFIEGQAHIVDWSPAEKKPTSTTALPKLLFTGPQRRPIASWNPAPVYALITIFHADAIAALAGIDISTMLDRICSADDALGGELILACDALWRDGDPADRVRRFEDRLDPLWQLARPAGHIATHMLQDWTRTLAVRAATSGTGRSLRQVERRIRSWTGQSLRRLGQGVLTERTHEISVLNRGKGLELARLAAEAGFADQSHMTRHIKRETGFTPDQLHARIETDEAFWCYRLMGERF